ncbi:hypothetical protein J8273_3863 [Carpediemonas membranifera]|uniref:Uncharacterized protein n=1 Tax=Carpediemonas membranifera TaxID=201153 RepID=A0A8J6B5B7_9EUKA|nr:hypothetical protein J8273_3863 [Carpediemonas membranifera]|eukprot:KAG9394609.1 hypothetical protein J8273_3863 [Carpediemonas membranifera]
MDARSSSDVVRHALEEAYRLSVAVTADVPGNIPSLLRHAYYRHFSKVMPVLQDRDACTTPTGDDAIDSLLAMIADIPTLAEKAQASLDRACSILRDGPPLSMNIPLKSGETLPESVFTLLQGTVWALLMSAGANPDLKPHRRDKRWVKLDKYIDIYDKRSTHLWFVCRKFYFAHQRAEKDGDVSLDDALSMGHRQYAGRLFGRLNSVMFGLSNDRNPVMFQRAQHIPPVVNVTTDRTDRPFVVERRDRPLVITTARGLYFWGVFAHGRLDCPIVLKPSRVDMSYCTKAVEFESRLPAWHKDRLISQIVVHDDVFVLTPVGALVAGDSVHRYGGPPDHLREDAYLVSICCTLYPVPLPDGLTPTAVSSDVGLTVLTAGRRQFIAGVNGGGQLGLGHTEYLDRFMEISYRFDRLLSWNGDFDFNVMLSGHQILYAGEILDVFRPFLDDHRRASTPTPLHFHRPVRRFWCSAAQVYWVHDGVTSVTLAQGEEIVSYEVGIEAFRMSGSFIRDTYDIRRLFMDCDGVWYCVDERGDGATFKTSSPVVVDNASVDSMLQEKGYVELFEVDVDAE